MNQTRLEVIKSIVTDTRHKRIIDELVAEIERLKAVVYQQEQFYEEQLQVIRQNHREEIERLQEELRVSKLPDDLWLEEYHKRRKAAKKGEK